MQEEAGRKTLNLSEVCDVDGRGCDVCQQGGWEGRGAENGTCVGAGSACGDRTHLRCVALTTGRITSSTSAW